MIEQTGMIEQELFHAQVAQLDTGIVPLQRSRFNEAKSNLKGLEYAALGVPFVASPTAEYERLAESKFEAGRGTIADVMVARNQDFCSPAGNGSGYLNEVSPLTVRHASDDHR